MVFGNKQARKRDTAIGLDLGSRQCKGVVVQRTAQGLQLRQYSVMPTPPTPGKAESQAAVVETTQTMLAKLGTAGHNVFVTISAPSAFVTKIEMPRFASGELRTVLRLNSTRYVRRDLGSYCLDAVELGEMAADSKARRSPTMQTLVAGASKEDVLWYRNTLNAAKIKAETIELAPVAIINALQRSHQQVCERHVVLLLDIGHHATSLNFLRQGQPVLTRLMPFGGAQLTEQIAHTLGVPPADAEQQKYAMNEQVTKVLHSALQTLAREIRASIDFVERQQDCEIRHAFAGGGTACNAAIVEVLSKEVGIEIQRWNPLEGYDTTSANPAGLEAVAPCLGAAIGVAVAKL